MKKKYTYDVFDYSMDGKSKGGGTGGTYLVGIRKNHNLFTKKYPNDIHLVIRRPDNKLMNFYHPFEFIDGIKS